MIVRKFADAARAASVLPVILLGAASAHAQQVVVNCAFELEWCEALRARFEATTGMKAAVTRKTDGEIMAQMRAEAGNPRFDIWHSAGADTAAIMIKDGFIEAYKSPKVAELHDWAVKFAEANKYALTPIYTGLIGFGYNSDLAAKKNMPEPKCWADLTNPAYKNEIQMADPSTSGTAYTMVTTILQLMGEDKGFDYLKALHKNINQYTRSGAAPAKAASLGETLIGITFMHDLVTMAVEGGPIKVVPPCEGTGYEVGSMSIIKGAKNPNQAKIFYDWALTPEAQALGAGAKSFQVPSNKNSPVPPQAPRLEQVKLIDYDFAKYGASAERKRLLSKWDKEVKALPK